MTKLIFKNFLFSTLLTFILVTSCNNNNSQKNTLPRFIYSDIITPGLYLEKYCTYESGAGIFDTGTDYEFYLTDSSNHKKDIGTCGEDEFFDFRLSDDKLIVRKICECRDLSDLSKIINLNKVVDSTVYYLEDLGFKISSTKKLTTEQKNTEIKSIVSSMIMIKGDTFSMGSDWSLDQLPIHKVTVNNYYISKYEVTQKLWKAVMDYNPSCFRDCDDCPVENVDWNEIQVFIEKLSQLTLKQFRLPTEAEWEFAARGGSKRKNYKYSGSDSIGQIAWYDENSNNKTHPVGQKKPNELGLFDMSGNVNEWCSDWYDDNYNNCITSTINPIGVDIGQLKVYRGGSFSQSIYDATPTYRHRANPNFGLWKGRGFRLAISN